MREILFRGKRLDNGEWVEGSLLGWCGRCFVCPKIYAVENKLSMFAPIEVDPSTVGQFTGMSDRNGKRIFEGDVVCAEDGYAVVKWDDDDAKFVVAGDWLVIDFDYCYGREFEVVGNCWDTPELLEEGLN